MRNRPLTVPLAVLAIMAAGCSSTASGPSESYMWGQKRVNTAVTLVHNGMSPAEACKGAIKAGSMWADDPVLNQDPPPKNFNVDDAQNGCLNQLHKQLGY